MPTTNVCSRNASSVANVSSNTAVVVEDSMSLSAGAESDFVWAVRLLKIWKKPMQRTWEFGTHIKGATFSLDGEEQQKRELAQELDAEGVGEAERLWLDKEGGFVII
jgi:hypothetical protein